MKRIPLFGTGVKSFSDTVTSQRRLNCYYDIREDGDKTNIVILGTPGLTLFTNSGLTSGEIRGIYPPCSDDLFLYEVINATLYQINTDGTVAFSYSGINTFTQPVSFSDNGQQYIIVDGTNGYVFTPTFANSLGTLTQIVSAGFPNGAKTVTFLNGFFICERPNTGQFYISDSYDGLTWDALQFATAEANTDTLVAVDSNHGNLILFGKKSIEFWQDTGTAPFPFNPILGATAQWGLGAIFSRANVNDTICFLASNQQGQFQFMMLNNYTPVRISTSDIEDIINGFSVVQDAVALSYLINGHGMYQVSFPSANRSFLFDTNTQMWSEVQTGADIQGRHIGELSTTFNGKSVISDYSNTNLYYIDPQMYTDNEDVIKRLVATRHVNKDDNVIGIDEIYIDMETGVGLQTGQGSDPQVMMRYSKDNGHTWSSEVWKGIGAVGEYKTRAIWRRIGAGRDIVFEFSMTDPVKFVITDGKATLRERVQ